MTDEVVKAGETRHFPDGVATVIGGSGGIGLACCGRLAEHGTDVALTYRSNRQAAEEALALIRQAGRSLPHLRKRGGAIVAMTSAGLVRHPPRDILSTVPKAGIEALVRGIAREEGRYGVRANAIALGVIDAGLFHRLTEQLPASFVDAMKRNTALRRFGTAREAADAAVFLASSVSGFVTGHSLVLDGGFAV